MTNVSHSTADSPTGSAYAASRRSKKAAALEVGIGSFATEMDCRHNVWFASDSDLTADITDWQLRAMNRRGQLCDKFEGRGPSRPTRLFCSDVNALEARNFDGLLHSAGSLQSRRFCGFRVESAHPNSGIPKRQASIRADAAPRRQISIRSPWRYQRTTVSVE